MFSNGKIYIHYGSTSFDINKFEHVQNCTCLPKPINGGLWASPEDAEQGWQKINSLRPQDVFYFKFKLVDTTKLLILNDKATLDGLPKITCESKVGPIILDFEKLSKMYDVICYKYNDEMDSLLPSWDCDCILVMNPNVISICK